MPLPERETVTKRHEREQRGHMDKLTAYCRPSLSILCDHVQGLEMNITEDNLI